MKPARLSDKLALPPGLSELDRMRELTRRIVAVPRDEAAKGEKAGRKARKKK